jgi:Cu/Ag efflux pump CusA
MTSFAFVFGVLPMAQATGAGAYSRNSLGIVIASGMLISTVLGRFVRQMHDQIIGRAGEDRAIAEEALAYGVALLEGKTEILG